jgi:hypothetical protein
LKKKYYEDFKESWKSVSCSYSNGQNKRSNASHKKSVFDNCSNGPSDVNHREPPFATCSDSPMDANDKEHIFARMSGRKVKTTDEEAFPCNLLDARSSRLDARSSCLDALQQNMKITVIHLDTQCPVRTPPPRNSFLTCFRIFER